MHLGNGALTPECAALAFGAAGLGLGAAAIDLGRQFSIRGLTPPARQEGSRQLGIAAVLGAFVFAAQMLNVPVLPGISAHLVGGLLLAWMAGPSLGAWTMAIILTVQAIVLGDGGLASLGANIVNMALLPAGVVYLLRRFDCLRISAAAGAAALTVVLAALLIPLETALFRSAGELAGWSDFASRMLLSHLAAGGVEGVLTLALLLALSPVTSPVAGTRIAWQTGLLRSAFCLALIAGLIACSTELPDGYEAAAESSGLAWLLK
ncbi:MAG: energy-coupling factor ABC transporter permease [Pirellulaceae bacterium]